MQIGRIFEQNGDQVSALQLPALIYVPTKDNQRQPRAKRKSTPGVFGLNIWYIIVQQIDLLLAEDNLLIYPEVLEASC